MNPRGRRFRLGVEGLERRDLPAAAALPAFLSAVGFGVSGKYSTIHPDAVATDAAGNTVVAGSFRGTVTFGAGATVTSSNTQDTFVVRYDPTGSLLWYRTFAGQSGTTTVGGSTATIYAVGQASAVAIDSTGAIFVGGEFTGTVNYGTASSPNLISSPASDEAFLLKLDPSGNVLWVRNAVGSGSGDEDPINALAPDGQGGLIVAGTFADSLTIGATTLTAVGASEAFVARYNGSGNATWATSTRGTAGSAAQATGVAVDSAGNIALAGTYAGTVTLDAGTATAATLTAAGSDDALVWKLNSTGGLLWADSFGSTGYDAGNGVAVDASGNIVVAGTFSNTVNFATGSTAIPLTAGPIFDPFVLKLTGAGATTWAKAYVSTSSSGWAKAQAVVIDPLGVIHLAGTFAGSADFDPNSAADVLSSVGSNDAFAAGLSATGNYIYAVQAGQTNFNAALGLAVSAGGAVALTGTYSGSIAFGSIADPSAGVASGFVARLQTAPTHTPTAPVLEAGSTTGSTNITSITSPTLDVLGAAAADTVTLLRDGVAVGSRVGPGAITDPGPVAQGIHRYSAVETSPAGVLGVAGASTAVSFLLTPPAAPTGLGLIAAYDSGVVGDGITNVRSPRLSGRAGAGLTVQISNAATGAVLTTTVAASDGSFTVAVGPLLDGTYSLQAVAIDAANNRSGAGPAFALRILTAIPATPAAPALLKVDDSGALGDGLTNVRSPHLVGTVASGLTVQISNVATKVVVATVVAASDGSYVAPVGVLADGTYSFQAVAIDLAGNRSAAGPAFALRILTTVPATPTAPVLLAADDSGTLGDGRTNVRSPRFTTTAPAGTTVNLVTAANVVVGSAPAASTGPTTVTVSSKLADGSYTLRVIAIDAAGNIGAASPATTITISTTLPTTPAAPALLARDDTGVAGDGMTSVRRPHIVGIATAGDRVDWLAANGSVVASTTAASNGSYSFQPAQALPDGTVAVTVRQTDGVGNVSATSATFPLTIRATTGDFFGDSRTDVAIYRPSTSAFWIIKPTPTPTTVVQTLGLPGDIPVAGDFFGNGHSDIAVYRPSNFTFYYLDPVTGVSGSFNTRGLKGDIPVPGDYDGDGRTDFAIFRPSTGLIIALLSGSGTVLTRTWGESGDIPVPADYFGDGVTDVAVYRPSNTTFYYLDAVTGAAGSFDTNGLPGDIPVPGDYDGDGKADIAIYRPSIVTFFAILSSTHTLAVQRWGYSSVDEPIPGDFFGGGRSSFAIFDPPAKSFAAIDPLTGATLFQLWGMPGDVPISPPLATEFNISGSNGGAAYAIIRTRQGPTVTTTPPAATATTTPESAASVTVDYIPVDGIVLEGAALLANTPAAKPADRLRKSP